MRLLKQLYKIHSPSRFEKNMRAFIQEWLEIRKIPYTVDVTGNILITKGCGPFSPSADKPQEAPKRDKPLLLAHMDQVQDELPEDTRIMNINGIIYGFSAMERRQVGLGADDKNGVWVCLKALEVIPVLKVALFVGEEIGCVGSGAVDMRFFDDCMFGIQCDRRGSCDFIHNASGVPLCTDEFIRAMKIKEWGYAKANGMMTDAMELRERGLPISVCNLSCGYYNPHTEFEVTDFEELQNCLSLVLHACRTIKTPQMAPVYECLVTIPYSQSKWWNYGAAYVDPKVKSGKKNATTAKTVTVKPETVTAKSPKPLTSTCDSNVRKWTIEEIYWELEEYLYHEVHSSSDCDKCQNLLFKLLNVTKEYENTSLEDAVMANVISEEDAKEIESLFDVPSYDPWDEI